MRDFLRRRGVGSRIIKTGIAVFLTAALCLSFNLSAVFAVITAIVTLEPTASESLRKGIIRFPASAIGSALAVFFVAMFGETALTYTLAATLTIYFCKQLKLDVGILVAVLTAIAMVPTVHDHFFIAFLNRLGTTTVGLTVSTLVNLLLFPPRYVSSIATAFDNHLETIKQVLEETVAIITTTIPPTNVAGILPLKHYNQLRRQIERTNDLITYQEVEWQYHEIHADDYLKLHNLKEKMNILQKMSLHLGNLQYVNIPIDFNNYERDLLLETTSSLSNILNNLDRAISDDHFYYIYEMDQYLKYEHSSGYRKVPNFFHHFRDKSIVFYEILSIHDSLEELHHIYAEQQKSLERSTEKSKSFSS